MSEGPADHAGRLGGWEDEGGALTATEEAENSAVYFRQRELHCRTRAEQCSRHGMRGTYLGFAARYAAHAARLEAEGIDEPMKLKIV